MKAYKDISSAIIPAITDYEDKVHDIVVKYYQIHTINGYNFYVLQNKETIKGSIAVDTVRHQKETVSETDMVCYVRSKQKLDTLNNADDIIATVEYNEHFFSFFTQEAYYEKAGNYIYTGHSIYYKNLHFFYDEEPVDFQNIPCDSSIKWLSLNLNIPVYLSYTAPLNIETPYLIVSIHSTDCIYLEPKLPNKLAGYQIDECTLTLYNCDSNEAARIAYYIYNVPFYQADLELAVMGGQFQFKSVQSDIQDAFLLKTNIKEAEVKVNYNVIYESLEAHKIIKSGAVSASFLEN